MRVHHLDCCTMCPRGRRALHCGGALNGEGRLLTRARLVSHCLLLETDAHGLVLVDTGIGVDDVRDTRRLGALFGPAMAIDATKTQMPALPQVEALGFRRADVRHIVLTHIDFDHAGGLPDFPAAKVHVHASEKEAALARATVQARTAWARLGDLRRSWRALEGDAGGAATRRATPRAPRPPPARSLARPRRDCGRHGTRLAGSCRRRLFSSKRARAG